MKSFENIDVKSVGQAVSLLQKFQQEKKQALVVGGGSEALQLVKDDVLAPDYVINLKTIPGLNTIKEERGGFRIGALTTLADVEDHPGVRDKLLILSAAAGEAASPQIRNAGTIGGNLGTASPAGDTLPVLVALGATVEVASAMARRALPIGEFLTGPKATALEPSELIVAVRFPVARGPQEYLKVGARNAMVIAVASVAVVVDLERLTVGVGLGSVGPVALPAPEASAWIAERVAWHDDGIVVTERGAAERFGEMVAEAAAPIDDHRSTAAYRRHAINVLASRALQRVAA